MSVVTQSWLRSDCVNERHAQINTFNFFSYCEGPCNVNFAALQSESLFQINLALLRHITFGTHTVLSPHVYKSYFKKGKRPLN